MTFVFSTSTLIGLSRTHVVGVVPEDFRLSLSLLGGVGPTFLGVTKWRVVRTRRPLARAAHSVSQIQPWLPPLNLLPLRFVFHFDRDFYVLAGVGSVRARERLRRNGTWCWETMEVWRGHFTCFLLDHIIHLKKFRMRPPGCFFSFHFRHFIFLDMEKSFWPLFFNTKYFY